MEEEMAHQTIHIALLVFALTAISSPAAAQAKSQSDRTAATPWAESSQAQKRESKRENGSIVPAPVTLATPPPADFLSGEANVGISDRSRWPIVILLSNDIRHDLSSPLRSRCFGKHALFTT
jgi:hypothetical protein